MLSEPVVLNAISVWTFALVAVFAFAFIAGCGRESGEARIRGMMGFIALCSAAMMVLLGSEVQVDVEPSGFASFIVGLWRWHPFGVAALGLIAALYVQRVRFN